MLQVVRARVRVARATTPRAGELLWPAAWLGRGLCVRARECARARVRVFVRASSGLAAPPPAVVAVVAAVSFGPPFAAE